MKPGVIHFTIDESHVGLIVGDVAGKGVEAATYAARANFTIKAFAYEYGQPAMVLKKTNDVLERIGGAKRFITLFYGVIDIVSGEIAYCNGGHPPALIAGKTGELRELITGSPVVGTFSDAQFKNGADILRRGDLLVIFTDGIIEARKGTDLFGLQRLKDIVKAKKFKSPKLPHEITRDIYSRVLEFSNSTLADDIAILALTLKD